MGFRDSDVSVRPRCGCTKERSGYATRSQQYLGLLTTLDLGGGRSLTLTVTATSAAHPAMSAPNAGGVAYAAMIPLSAVVPNEASFPLFGSLMILGLGLMLWPAGRRRRLVSGALLLVVLAAGPVGCGGGSSTRTVAVSSTITVTAVNASGAGGATGGLPLKDNGERSAFVICSLLSLRPLVQSLRVRPCAAVAMPGIYDAQGHLKLALSGCIFTRWARAWSAQAHLFLPAYRERDEKRSGGLVVLHCPAGFNHVWEKSQGREAPVPLLLLVDRLDNLK